MINTKFTPGPWSVNTWKHKTDTSIRIGAKGTPMLARVPSEFVSINEQRANAELIAAAPDLYEALKNFENDNEHIPAKIWDLRNKALDKAEGK